MSESQIKLFCSFINIEDVISYIDEHQRKYKQYEEEIKEKEDKNVICTTKKQ